MGKQFKNKEELDKWLEEKDMELYPSENMGWDINPCHMSNEEIISELTKSGYANLDNLLESGEEYELCGHTNVR